MSCEKRNKKLFTHIAIGVLVILIVYNIVEAFFPKNKLEGFGGGSEKIIDYKLEANSWTFPPGEIHDYIKAYYDVTMIKKEKVNKKKNSKNKEDKNIMKHFTDLVNKIEEKLGKNKYKMADGSRKSNLEILFKAIQNDSSSKTGALNKKSQNSEEASIIAASNDIMNKIDKLSKEWQKNKPKTDK